MLSQQPVPLDGPKQRDRHVLAWKSLQAVRSKPKPPVGGPPPTADGATGADAPSPFVPRPAYVDSPWLQGLSRFGPVPSETRSTPSAFDTADPSSPPWLEQLQDEWVCPTQFLDLWQPDWNKTFAPLYAANPKWQRVWRNGIGLPRQGYFVRDKLLYTIVYTVAVLRPATPAPNLEEGYTCCMALRRSTRAKTPAPSLQAQPVPQPQPAPSTGPKRRPKQLWRPPTPCQACQRCHLLDQSNETVMCAFGRPCKMCAPGPSPRSGGRPPTADGRTGTANPAPFTPQPEYMDDKWLQDLSRFGPTPTEPRSTPSAFDTADPVSPPWLEQLQDEWVCPTQFLDL